MPRVNLLTTTSTALDGLGNSTVNRSALARGAATSGTPTFTQSSTAFRSGYRAMTGIGDYVEFSELLNAGTYALVLETVTAASGGKFEVHVDGVVVVTNDTYLASGGGATRTETAGIVITTTGKHVVKLVVIAKNGSSSSTTCRISGYTMSRTGA